MNDISNETPGLRERKRAETLERIGEAGIKLFVGKGYEATTLDDIAAAAGISRRTFFHYFKSKDDILVALQCEPAVEALGHAFDSVPKGTTPFDALRKILPELVGSFESEQSIAIANIMQSTDALKVRKLAIFVDIENALFQALTRAWPEPANEAALRLLATVSMGVLRVSNEQWRQEGGKRRIGDYVRQNFILLSQAERPQHR